MVKDKVRVTTRSQQLFPGLIPQVLFYRGSWFNYPQPKSLCHILSQGRASSCPKHQSWMCHSQPGITDYHCGHPKSQTDRLGTREHTENPHSEA